MSKSNADFSRLISSNKYILTPSDDTHRSANGNKNKQNDASEISDLKRAEKKRKRAERKKKYFDRKKAAKEKERAQKEEDEFNRQLKAKLSQSENKHFEDLPEEYRKLIGGDFEHTHMVKGLDYGLLRQTKDKIAKQQTEDIEDAYNDTKTVGEHINDGDAEGDISMIMDIQSVWAQNIHKSVMKYYTKDTQDAIDTKQIQINPKFCNGMTYKFALDSETSVPTEIMRSQIGYGLVLDDFNEFEDDNTDKKICSGYTPMDTICAIEKALNKTKDTKDETVIIKQNKIDKEMEENVDNKGKKRKLSEMKEEIKCADDDFDIFEDAGRDYVCDTEQEPKRRRVAFMTPTMEKIQQKLSYFEGNTNVNRNSNVKQAAASILKSSLNKVKMEKMKEKKRENIIPGMPSLENDGKRKKEKKTNVNSLRGRLLSSGFSAYDDDDIEDMNSYNSDDDDASKKNTTSAKVDMEWKQIQEKFGKTGKNTSDSVKERLNNPQNTPSLRKFFS